MGLFSKKKSAMSEAQQLTEPATIIVTCNSIPSHKKAVYWFNVLLNDEIVGRIEQNGIPSTFTTTVDKNALVLQLCIQENNGGISKFPTGTQNLDLKSGETVRVVFENRRFTVESAG